MLSAVVETHQFIPSNVRPVPSSTQLFLWKNWMTLARSRRMNEAGNMTSVDSAYLK